MKRVLLALGLAFFAFSAPRPAAADEATPEAQALAYVRGVREQKGTPAVTVAVWWNGRVRVSEGFGFADLENRVPATGESVFNVGSVSKIQTAIAVMQLVESGKVSLDDPIQEYVPSFPEKPEGRITVRHLMTHTSGIRHYLPTDFPDSEDNESTRPLSWEAGLEVFRRDPLLFPPGQLYFYSSYAVNLLQGVVERASGMAFEAYMKLRVWDPAGMPSAAFDVPERIVPHRARSYRMLDGKPANYYYNDLRYKFASGGMLSSAVDLVRFGGALNAGRLLRPETTALLYAAQPGTALRFERDGKPSTQGFVQGLLWRVFKDSKGRTFVNHCGTVKGFNACLVDYPGEDLVVAVMGNADAVSPARNETVAVAQFFLDGHGR